MKKTFQKNIRAKKISELKIADLISILNYENISFSLESWESPKILYITNMLFPDTIIIEFNQKKKNEYFFSDSIVFYFNYKDLTFQWHLKKHVNTYKSEPIKSSTIKFLKSKNYEMYLK